MTLAGLLRRVLELRGAGDVDQGGRRSREPVGDDPFLVLGVDEADHAAHRERVRDARQRLELEALDLGLAGVGHVAGEPGDVTGRVEGRHRARESGRWCSRCRRPPRWSGCGRCGSADFRPSSVVFTSSGSTPFRFTSESGARGIAPQVHARVEEPALEAFRVGRVKVVIRRELPAEADLGRELRVGAGEVALAHVRVDGEPDGGRIAQRGRAQEAEVGPLVDARLALVARVAPADAHVERLGDVVAGVGESRPGLGVDVVHRVERQPAGRVEQHVELVERVRPHEVDAGHALQPFARVGELEFLAALVVRVDRRRLEERRVERVEVDRRVGLGGAMRGDRLERQRGVDRVVHEQGFAPGLHLLGVPEHRVQVGPRVEFVRRAGLRCPGRGRGSGDAPARGSESSTVRSAAKRMKSALDGMNSALMRPARTSLL